MEQISIVEYTPAYAKAVAAMWNRSSEGWNGRIFNSTEAKVLHEEGDTPCLNLYLAVQDDIVIGYAKLGKYTDEAGVAYIEMLNVLPEYHGQGIGKELVQKCVLRTAELGYERIDLFTWAGNTKAVPLYKKCGYFWEKMDTQSTHLMNFIPGLLNNELLKPYFNYFDWYADNIRTLETVPDGRSVNGFDLYDYIWEKDDKRLEISFEKSGRGIVAIRTPDFSVSTEIADAKPVFGLSYPVNYSLESLGTSSIEVSLQGKDDDVIRYIFSAKRQLNGKTNLAADYYIAPLTKHLSEWESCPALITKLSINGKAINLKTGLKVQYPLSVNLRRESSIMYPGREEMLYLNVHNHFNVPCAYHIEIPEPEQLHLKQNCFDIFLQADERSHIPILITASKACVFYPQLAIQASPENGSRLEFTTDCYDNIPMQGSMDGKDMQDLACMINSHFSCQLYKQERKNWANFHSIFGAGFSFAPPQMGQPYSEEFDSELPYAIQIEEMGSVMQITSKYRSREIPELDFGMVYRLTPSGLLEFYYKIYQLPTRDEDVIAKFRVYTRLDELAFEHQGRLIQLEKDILDVGISDFNRDAIDSNWLFIKTDDSTGAIIWPVGQKAIVDHWLLAWEVNFSDLQRQGKDTTEAICMYLDVFKNPWQVRNAAAKRKPMETVFPTLELMLNNGNPWISIPYKAKLYEHKEQQLTGTFTLKTSSGLCLEQKLGSADNEPAGDGVRCVEWEVDTPPQQALELVTCEAELPFTTLQRSQLALFSKGETVFTSEPNMLIADNGCLQIAAPTDARLPGLHSLKHLGQEWLDSGYPFYQPKSFFNPFQGGMGITHTQIGLAALSLEQHLVERVSMSDQYGNIWEGIAILSTICGFEPLKGLAFRQYYLLRPGVPVLAILTEVLGSPGWAQFHNFRLMITQKHSAGEKDGGVLIPHKGNRWQQVTVGTEQFMAGDYYPQSAMFMDGSELRMQIVSRSKLNYHAYMDAAVIRNSATYYSEMIVDEPGFAAPIFVVFAKQLYQPEWLVALLNTKFER